MENYSTHHHDRIEMTSNEQGQEAASGSRANPAPLSVGID